VYLLDFHIEEYGLPMDTWCPHFIDTEKYVWLNVDKTRDMGILTTGCADVVKAFELQEETICIFEFIVENNVVCLVINPP
jgi:hypothetical protein